MSDTWLEGYNNYTTYTCGYYREMNPVHIRFCLLLQGIAGPDEQDFNYCELAFGQGFSANIHASANSANFVGMDFNPKHASFAEKLAKDSQNNLIVSDESFEQFCYKEQPKYDYICLHGGWSWISEANRKHILHFLDKHLKVGGVFYLSWNCQPGWSALTPLRELCVLFDKNFNCQAMPGQLRIEKSLMQVAEFLEQKPLFLNASSWIKEQFGIMQEAPVPWLAHEFFNQDWHICYYRELAAELAKVKLHFAASAMAVNNLNGFGLTPEALRYIQQVEDVDIWQQLWDFFCNTRFRADIFIKGGTQLSKEEQIERLLEQDFAQVMLREQFSLTMDAGMCSFRLDDNLHGKILEFLAKDHYQPKSGAAILEHLPQLKKEQLLPILAQLVGKGCVQPCQQAEIAKANLPKCQNLNKVIAKNAEYANNLQFLASAVTGGGLSCHRLELLFLNAFLEQKSYPSWQELQGQKELWQDLHLPDFNRDDMNEDQDLQDYLAKFSQDFEKITLPRWQNLGILAR